MSTRHQSSTEEIIEGVAVLKRTSWPFLFALAVVLWSQYYCFVSLYDVSVSHRDALQKYLGPPSAVFAHWSIGVDQADVQWKDLVKNLPLLGPVLGGMCLVARYFRVSYATESLKLNNVILNYYCITGFIFIAYLHGAPVLFELALVLVNYFAIAPLSKMLNFKVFMILMWSAHISILFINDHYHGFRFSMIAESLRWMDESLPAGVLRWNVVFNMCTLRMIAYNIDYYEATTMAVGSVDRQAKIDKHTSSCTDCAALRAANATASAVSMSGDQSLCCYKLRTETPRPVADYNLRGYIAYLFYVPLYIAGPMSSYNAFISHTYYSTKSMSLKQGCVYATRIIFLYAMLTFQLHFNYLNAIREVHDVFDAMPLSTKLPFFLFTLGFLWMKFNFLWKFFRLLAFIDGVEAPEDMNRCFADTLTIQSFWKDWHSSFNLWIVRYMYIPMGGSKNRLLSIFPIFVFIAIWHDIELRLLWWAMIMCVCFIPEVLVGLFMSRPQMKWLRNKPYYRYVRAAGGAVGMFILITANLVGYGTGTRSVGKGLAEAFSLELGGFFLVAMFVLYCSAILAVRDRESKDAEKRRLRVLYGVKTDHRL